MCQHGEVECQANIIHCCSIEAIHDTETRLNMVACMIIDNANPTESFLRVRFDAILIDSIHNLVPVLVFETVHY